MSPRCSRLPGKIILCVGLLACGLAALGGRDATAAEPENWADLHKGRLYATLDQDVEQAITIYETILYHLSATDPQRGQLLYWLGQARLKSGDHDIARQNLSEAAQFPAVRGPATALLQMIDVWENRVTRLPYHTEPDTVLSPEESYMLAFAEMDLLNREIHFRLRAEGAPTVVRLVLEDVNGRALPAIDTINVPMDEWTTFSVEPSDFRLAAQETPPLWIVRVEQHQEAAGEDARVRIAEVEVR